MIDIRRLVALVVCSALLSHTGRAARPLANSVVSSIVDTDEDGMALIEPTSSRRGQADFLDGDDVGIKNHWALLVAGSNGWWNYRHQADVCHAYQVLRQGGFLPQHIVIMMYDDIANNEENPHHGAIFNSPDGVDVYHGVKHAIDYRGPDVTAKNFLAVLSGDAEAVRGIGSGRVVAAGPDDRLFVFYSDHGAAGVLGMPSGDFLYADDMMGAIRHRRAHGGYRELVVYIEACESGSLFEGMVGEDLAMYATTAANGTESSWGTYCPGMSQPPPAEFTTCLGDLYSVAWMEDSDFSDLTAESLMAQYLKVLERTSNNMTFDMGSHVMQFGSLAINGEKAGDYIGMNHKGNAPHPRGSSSAAGHTIRSRASGQQQRQQQAAGQGLTHVPQRDADLLHWQVKAQRSAGDAEAARAAQAALDAALEQRRRVDAAARDAASHLLQSSASSTLLASHLVWPPSLQPLAAPAGGSSPASPAEQLALADHLVSGTFGRPAEGVPLVDSWQCLKDMVAAWSGQCGRMDDYSMRHTRFFANLCNAGVDAHALSAALVAAGGCSADRVVQA